jgi:hypothetical protein
VAAGRQKRFFRVQIKEFLAQNFKRKIVHRRKMIDSGSLLPSIFLTTFLKVDPERIRS